MWPSLSEDYPIMQEKVRKILQQYILLGNVGQLEAIKIESVLRRADKAAINGDLIDMIRVYNEMKEIK
jgi:hypothetical protein